MKDTKRRALSKTRITALKLDSVRVPRDCSNHILSFLRVREVCITRGVSRSFGALTAHALRVPRRIRHEPNVDGDAMEWLRRIVGMRLNITAVEVNQRAALQQVDRGGDHDRVTCDVLRLLSRFTDFDDALVDNAEVATICLDVAMQFDDKELIKRFLLRNVGVNTCTVALSPYHTLLSNATLVHRAAYQGSPWLMHELLSDQRFGADATKAASCPMLGHENVFPIHIAAWCGKIDTLNVLLNDSTVDPNVADSLGYTILHYAHAFSMEKCRSLTFDVERESRWSSLPEYYWRYHCARPCADDICKNTFAALLERADVDALVRDHQSRTLLHFTAACTSSDTPSKDMQLLIAQGKVDINAQSARGKTALHCAVEHGCVGSVKALLGCKDIDVNIRDASGNSPLHAAVKAAFNPYLFCDRANFRECVSLLLKDHRVNVHATNCDGETALHFASERVLIQTMRTLLARGADVNAQCITGESPLHRAVKTGYPKNIEELLKCEEIDVNMRDYSGDTALHVSVKKFIFQSSNVLQLLLKDQRLDVNSRNVYHETALHYASAHCNSVVINMLLAHGSDVNAQNLFGRTALHCAAEELNLSNFRVLLNCKDIDIDKRDYCGDTLLHVVIKERYKSESWRHSRTDVEEFIALLLDYFGIKVNIPNLLGETALHYASAGFEPGIVEILLAHGSDASKCSYDGRNAVHHLVSNPCDDQEQIANIMRLLCRDERLDVNALTLDGKAAIHLAVEQNDKPGVAALMSCDSRVLKATDALVRTVLHMAITSARSDDEAEELLAQLLIVVEEDECGRSIATGYRCNIGLGAQSADGSTVLHLCAEKDFCKCATALMCLPEVDIDALNAAGKTALDVAHSKEMEYTLTRQRGSFILARVRAP